MLRQLVIVIQRPLNVGLASLFVAVACAFSQALPKYEVQVKFGDRQFPCNGVVITQQMEDVHPFPFRFTGGDDLAEKARGIRVGKSYELRGVIAELTLGSSAGKKYGKDVRIRLVNFEFEPLAK